MSDQELYEARSAFCRRGSAAVVVDLERIGEEVREEEMSRHMRDFAANVPSRSATPGLSEYDRRRLCGQIKEATQRLRTALIATPRSNERAGVAILDAIDILDGLARRMGSVA